MPKSNKSNPYALLVRSSVTELAQAVDGLQPYDGLTGPITPDDMQSRYGTVMGILDKSLASYAYKLANGEIEMSSTADLARLTDLMIKVEAAHKSDAPPESINNVAAGTPIDIDETNPAFQQLIEQVYVDLNSKNDIG